MQIVSSVSEAGARSRESGKRRVLVPTMGALHRGHLELIRIAREAAGKEGEVAVSIFVNPLQLRRAGITRNIRGPETDDEEFCRERRRGYSFPARLRTKCMPPIFRSRSRRIRFRRRCAANRGPGIFAGSARWWRSSFNILAPDAAVFGEKDFQQLAIIRRMVRDLNFPIEIIGAPTVRESDGLACSSRNQYLSATERQQAPVLRAALLEGARLAAGGERSAAAIIEAARKMIGTAPLARIDYLELVNAETLQPIEIVQPNSLIALAAFFGEDSV